MIRLLSAAAVISALASPALSEPHRYELDPSHTTIAFLVDHIGYADTLGVFLEFEGAFTYDMESQTLSDVVITVKTPSVETFNDARDGHVRGKDFLDVEKFPVMTFTATSGTPTGENTGKVEGELNLLGESRPLTLDVTLNKAAKYPFDHGRFTLGLSARTTVTRSDYGMSYAVENGLVGDDVEVIIETEAMRIE